MSGVDTLAPVVGDVIARLGAVVSTVTCTETAARLPAASVAFTTIVCAPSASVSVVVKAPATPTLTAVPSTVTVAPGSVVPDTTTADWFVRPVVGEVKVRAGGTSSRVTVTDVVAVFPAAFVATAVMVFRPSSSGSATLNPPEPETAAWTPFTATVAPGSVVPLTWATGCRVRLPVRGAVIDRLGGVVSTVTATETDA